MVFAEIACCELLRSQAFYMLGYLRGLFNYMSWFASSGFVFDERLLTAKMLRLYRERILTAEASRGGKGEKRMGVCPLPHSGGRLQILHGPWRFFGQFHSSIIYHGLCLIQESRGVAGVARRERPFVLFNWPIPSSPSRGIVRGCSVRCFRSIFIARRTLPSRSQSKLDCFRLGWWVCWLCGCARRRRYPRAIRDQPSCVDGYWTERHE